MGSLFPPDLHVPGTGLGVLWWGLHSSPTTYSYEGISTAAWIVHVPRGRALPVFSLEMRKRDVNGKGLWSVSVSCDGLTHGDSLPLRVEEALSILRWGGLPLVWSIWGFWYPKWVLEPISLGH